MLLENEVEIVISGNTIKYYEDLGYIIPREFNKRNKKFQVKRGTKIKVLLKHLHFNSSARVSVQCDNCNKILNIEYQGYNNYKKEDNKYYCVSCSHILYSSKNATLTKLSKSKSFEQWCIENNRQDVLDRWDYDLNKCNPSEITMKTKTKYHFKCSKGIHDSEIKSIGDFTGGCEGSIKCIKCNSFAQFLLDDYGELGVCKFWSDNNLENPFAISKYRNSSQGKVWIKCENNNLHKDYLVACDNFVKGSRCPECNSSKGEKEIKKFMIKNKLSYIPQKTYDFLIGIGGSLLSYDFYLPDYNLLIEYQGEFHDGSNGEYTKQKLVYQQEHDRRKCEYAENNNIKLLEIWYWDFENIEKILSKELILSN